MSESESVPPSVVREMELLRSECMALQQQIERFHVLQRISQELASELDLDLLLCSILRSAVKVMEATAGALLLLDKTTDELAFMVVEGGGGERLLNRRMSRHQGIAGWVLNHHQAVIVDDTLKDERFYAEIGRSVDFETTSMITAPMMARGEAIGVLQVLNKRDGERFNESDKELLIAFASQSAIAIRNVQLYQDLRDERDRLVAVEEDVRKNLARDLHDGPTQIVAAIMMNLQFVHKLLEHEPEKVDAELGEVSNLADRAMRQLRTMLFDLRPLILETQGLIPALEAYTDRLTQNERFTVHLMVEGDVPRLSKKADSAIFAVLQEAVTNVRKHAHADNVWITLVRQDDVLGVSVRDDGVGFDISEMRAGYESRGSLGLVNMRERVEMVQGTFSLDSTVGGGTSVRFAVPLKVNLRGENSS